MNKNLFVYAMTVMKIEIYNQKQNILNSNEKYGKILTKSYKLYGDQM